jgi:hypothetical protein
LQFAGKRSRFTKTFWGTCSVYGKYAEHMHSGVLSRIRLRRIIHPTSDTRHAAAVDVGVSFGNMGSSKRNGERAIATLAALRSVPEQGLLDWSL